MAQKGINLGGWLVLEKWITPTLFAGSDALDEFSLVAAGEHYRSRIIRHYETFITKDDIRWLSQHDITHLRVPIGYWLFGQSEPFIPTVDYLDRLFDWADQYDLKILPSIHAAPGSQNGEHHSGKIGGVHWHKNSKQLVNFTERVIKRYGSRESFDGIGLLNEPSGSLRNIPRLIWHYRTVIRRIRHSSNPTAALYIDGTFHTRLWAVVARWLRVGLDVHLYHGFGDTNTSTALQKLAKSHRLLQRICRNTPVIIGEWSGVIHHQPDTHTTENYIKKQQAAYSPVNAEYYWTYKTEDGGVWSFRDH